MIKHASSRLQGAIESIRSEVDGVGDCKAWSEQIPRDKAHNLQKVMNIAQETLLTLELSVANDRMQRAHELFDLKREDTDSCDLTGGLVTKYNSLTARKNRTQRS